MAYLKFHLLAFAAKNILSTNSLQLFFVEFDTCLVWELLLLPSNAPTAPNLPSLKGARWRHWRGVISAV